MQHQRDRREADANRAEEALAFADELRLLFLVGTKLPGVPDLVADILQGGEEVLRRHAARIVLHERLLVGQTHAYLVHAGEPTDRLLDRPRAERTVETSDLGQEPRPASGRDAVLHPIRSGTRRMFMSDIDGHGVMGTHRDTS